MRAGIAALVEAGQLKKGRAGMAWDVSGHQPSQVVPKSLILPAKLQVGTRYAVFLMLVIRVQQTILLITDGRIGRNFLVPYIYALVTVDIANQIVALLSDLLSGAKKDIG